MSFTFSDQQTLLSTLLGSSNTNSDDMFPLAVRKKQINRGEVALARRTKALRELATGTLSGSTLSIPADWIETFALIVNNKLITNDREISIKDWDRYQDWGGADPFYYFWESSGTRQYFFFGSGLSGQSYRLYYYQIPTTELSSDSDTSLFPEEYREASVYWAAYTLLHQIGKTELSSRYRLVFDEYVRTIQADVERQVVDAERPVPDFNIVSPSTTDRQGTGFSY